MAFSHFTDDVRNDMAYAEAQEYGAFSDDAEVANETYDIPHRILIELGLTSEEVEQRAPSGVLPE